MTILLGLSLCRPPHLHAMSRSRDFLGTLGMVHQTKFIVGTRHNQGNTLEDYRTPKDDSTSGQGNSERR